ncbi:MAG TPA: hypothetical protein RMH85_18850 [Polyangiaceae bacterium LLY-WYZ-15_(1-7)]|nr:hypothetical protein [Myxococcales bacterium]MAT23848.1 hypothetical protein [Sandaracinus sp.]HJK90606.1 hypothetical protein [Polyangiaceae bacterium LLY-WYZ-15_(1-7)]HJL06656.1 hypothetical protein [Polyangiaceae bacterium LLY-WYZ-15_(1-7)]HJL10567.1 hypothetical protein [Polyangiaceae bacterium LLY-WYZ-15_(1-7)]
MSDPRKADRSVNRLLDIVVEEVSLVDRAANEHRFLIVKRDTPMADHADTDTQEQGAEPSADAPATEEGAPATISDDPPEATAPDPLLATAVAALEGLTSTVELLGAMGAQAADARLAPLATELKTTAEALLARAGVEPAATGGGDADTESTEEPSDAKDRDAFAEHLQAARAALTQLASLTSAPASEPEAAATPTEAPAKLPDDLTTTLAAMGESFRALADTVKEQQQRLARVEKQFGLPNSSQSPESVRKVAPEEVGWPMDLNNPMDRESVDKAVSFHDL